MAKSKKIGTPKTQRALAMWRGITLAALKKMPLDLSARQTAVLLTVHLEPGPHSIKSLAANLAISKPAICRALDVLEAAKLLRRATDKKDRRNVWVLPAAKGSVYLHELAGIILQASRTAA